MFLVLTACRQLKLHQSLKLRVFKVCLSITYLQSNIVHAIIHSSRQEEPLRHSTNRLRGGVESTFVCPLFGSCPHKAD